MSEEMKIATVIAGALLLCVCVVGASCNYQAKLDSMAPVVESCVKHPSTRNPFRAQQ